MLCHRGGNPAAINKRLPRIRQLEAQELNQKIVIDDQPSHRYRRALFGGIQPEHTMYKLPPDIEHNLVNWDCIPATEGSKMDLPVFWHSMVEQGQQDHPSHWEWMQQQQAANPDKQWRL